MMARVAFSTVLVHFEITYVTDVDRVPTHLSLHVSIKRVLDLINHSTIAISVVFHAMHGHFVLHVSHLPQPFFVEYSSCDWWSKFMYSAAARRSWSSGLWFVLAIPVMASIVLSREGRIT